MTDNNAALANTSDLQPHKVETPKISYSFYCESNADMTTVDGRLEWFCTHFEIKPGADFHAEISKAAEQINGNERNKLS